MKGTLYIVSTPIGNLGDMTVRAIEILKDVDLVAAEDTRHTRKLFSRYGIKTPLVSYYGPKEEIRGEEIIRELETGRKVALVSDAGTPGISDPGHYLVRRAADEGHDILTIPGPSALISALTLSGLPTARFVFEGFLPPKSGARRKRLKALKGEERTIVLYESPRRVMKTLRDIQEVMGDRAAALARELTKVYEEVIRGKVSDIIKILEDKGARGEITLIIAGSGEREGAEDVDIDRVVKDVLKKGLSAKDAAGEVARTSGISKRRAYQAVLKIKEGG